MPQKINSLAKTSEVNTQNRSCSRVSRASQFWRKIKELSCIWLLMKEKRAILPCYHQLIRHYRQAGTHCHVCQGNQMYYSNVKQNKSDCNSDREEYNLPAQRCWINFRWELKGSSGIGSINFPEERCLSIQTTILLRQKILFSKFDSHARWWPLQAKTRVMKSNRQCSKILLWL